MADVQNILLVDDDALVRRALERALRSPEYRVFPAQSAAAAIELLEKHTFVAVISDHLMPGMTGLELMREVHRRCPQCVRIIISGFMPERVNDALESGEIDHFMTKPWENSDLRETLRLAIDRRVAQHPPVKDNPAA